MSICIDAGWKKMTGYYQKADRAPGYIATIVLDPTNIWSYFQDWEPEWQTDAKRSLKAFWEYSYRSSTGLVQRVDPADAATNSSNNSFLRWMAKKKAQPIDSLDELEQYVSDIRLIEVGSLIS